MIKYNHEYNGFVEFCESSSEESDPKGTIWTWWLPLTSLVSYVATLPLIHSILMFLAALMWLP